ncbi:hypothetical protein ACJH6J_02740 [Mycobacterium sp. SMC-18]|uniref:hypothetical protein n=1 Tax=Mycobacteriaceae TaxID=1762 RepID=UPI001BB31B47|nr:MULTISPECIES: hypothetical protein [unclassified Mycolicibacterium]BCI78678.1 hypothetical protein MTY66_03030 [Mycolicibacterium sp. TY66]BCJ83661.1 hypothetical protein MTY81_50340 [Mycolicibacterium sp. TY81]
MSENHEAGPASEQPPTAGDLEEKTQFVDRSAFQSPSAALPGTGDQTQVVPSTAAAPETGDQTQVVPPTVAAPQWQPPQPPAAPNPYGQQVPPAAPQWQPPQPGYQPPQSQFGQPGAPVPPQPEQPWNPAGAPVPPPPPPGFGAPTYGAPGFGAPGFGAPIPPGFGPGGAQPGFGAPQPGGYPGPGAPQFGGPAGPQQTPVDMAKSLLTKGDSFIFRLMTRGVRGELIQQPWFQNMRNNPQGSNQFVYLGYGGAVLIGLFLSLFGGIGSLIASVVWLGLAYCFLALGTKLAAQFVAYGICGVGAAASLLGLLIGIIGLAGVSSSPYISGSLTAMLILAVVINGVIAVVLGYIGIQVHKGIQKIAAGQF